jgi:hypothetical protein
LSWLVLPAQDDTLYYEEDSLQMPPVRFHLQTLSAAVMDGNVQFFEGYSHEILYSDASSGLPLYSDWVLYSNSQLLPKYFQAGVQAGFTDTLRALRLRLGLQYAHRVDSLAYTSDFFTNDTVLGRLGSERGGFVGISVAGIKQSKKLLGFLRLYGGAELELGLSPRGRISFAEYSYDLGDQQLLDYNRFSAFSKPRMSVFVNALLGFETVFAQRFGIIGELRSGLGSQIVVKEKAKGMARTAIQLGLQYYLWDYIKKPLPQRPHVIEEEPITPLPQF